MYRSGERVSKENQAAPGPAVGAVLTGGASRRMGVDKAFIAWEGRPLAQHVAERVARACARVVLVGGAGRGYEALGLPWWPDPAGLEGRGPLAGLVAALGRAPRILLVACDLPEVEALVLGRLMAAAGSAPVAMPVWGDGRLEPTVGVYARGALGAARSSLAGGSGRMSDLLSVRGARLIPIEALGSEAQVTRVFRNLNRPEDLAAARTVI